MRPSSRNRISSACISADSRCEMMIVARLRFKSFSASRMRNSVPASIAAVESSNTMMRGVRRTLRARQRHTTLADEGVVTFRQAGHVIVQLRGVRGIDDAIVFGDGIAVSDV